MIRREALRPEHLKGFESTQSMGPVPEQQFGEAQAFVEDGRVLAILGGWKNDGAVELGLMLAPEARRYPVTLHKAALNFIEGMRLVGHERLRAWPVDYRGAQWLRRLGFEPVNSGAFERCLSR